MSHRWCRAAWLALLGASSSLAGAQTFVVDEIPAKASVLGTRPTLVPGLLVAYTSPLPLDANAWSATLGQWSRPPVPWDGEWAASFFADPLIAGRDVMMTSLWRRIPTGLRLLAACRHEGRNGAGEGTPVIRDTSPAAIEQIGRWREALVMTIAGAGDRDDGSLVAEIQDYTHLTGDPSLAGMYFDREDGFADCVDERTEKDCTNCCQAEGKAAERACQLTAGLAGASAYLAGGPVASLIVGSGVHYLCLRVADAGTRKCLTSCEMKARPGFSNLYF